MHTETCRHKALSRAWDVTLKQNTHTHLQNESLVQKRMYSNLKPVFPACVRNVYQQAGISHKPFSQETKADKQIETLCVHVRCFFSNVWGLFRYSHLRVGFILLQCLICSCALHLHVSILKWSFVSAYVYAWNFGLSLTLETLVLCHVIVIWLRGESHTFDVTNWKTLKVCGTLWGKKWQRKEELSETSDC